MKRRTVILIFIIAAAMSISAFLRMAVFGRMPSGARLKRIKKSPNYRDGAFQNQSFTPDLTEGATYYTVMKEFALGDKKRQQPEASLPSHKTDLKTLSPNENVLVWFGHSSYFIQVDGKKILIDPVLSGNASPLSFTTKAFTGTDRYSVDDFPEIDYLFISHDHYDHLDYKTIVKLKSKVKTVITALGTGEHLEYWGYNPKIIIEKDWYDNVDLGNGFNVTLTPGRHFSGRMFKRNQALWTSFVLKTPSQNLFLGGDSGYDKHFAEIGEKFGPFDLAILENGQYNKSWKHIHLMPHEILQAAKDLNTKRLFPVHSSKFALANHAWDEPLNKIVENNKKENLNLVTPMIGEKVDLNNSEQTFTEWWKSVK
ncbi:MBL fold metallo-hydrolase [Lacihabitans soyangensis]|uniref:MBL fold metallo-hydrolase n=1 Tax=Lacihabitans soyangensis TaxID=869394 RepID=A0AAE3H2S6_9BACT|nr:MBL fold metallo-hydrolase [Lacihabitans soyangensis]MCP9763250.1 MBL fold metallo-hydrolase [Lacihabitans soyangensis]